MHNQIIMLDVVGRNREEGKRLKNVPTGMKEKSESLFSIVLTVLSRPLGKNVPELVRTL